MAKKRLNRTQTISRLLLILAILIAGAISYGISMLTGKFTLKVFWIALAVSIVVLFIAFFVLTRPTIKGKIGEAKVSRVLKRLKRENGGDFIHDVIVIGDDGKSSQIDHIYICRKGFFVIEVKNYAGRIYGNDEQKQWMQVLAYGNTKNKLYNPIMQNRTHIWRLKEYLSEPVRMTSIVVFTNGNLNYLDSENVHRLSDIRGIVNGNHTFLSEHQVSSYLEKIRYLKENPPISSKEHVTSIKVAKVRMENGYCPRCGSKLVLRTSQTGSKFYGCSNYPKCTFTKSTQ